MDDPIIEVPGRKLGKRAPDLAKLRRTIWLEGYLTPTVPPPDSTSWSANAGPALAQMYDNDSEGDCVIAEVMHMIGVINAAKSGAPAVGTTAEARSQYHAVCGGGDNGCDISAVLDHWRDNGIIVGGKLHRIDGYVAFDWTNADMWKFAICLFGGVPFGINLPNAWYQSQAGAVWDVTSTRIVGLHGIPAVDYNAKGPIISTWGTTHQMTWAAATSRSYVDEAYVALSPDWYGADNLAPSGLDVDALKADLQLIKNGQSPVIAPVVPPWLDLMGGGL